MDNIYAAQKVPIIYIFYIYYLWCKAVPINDNGYSCDITAIELV